MIANDGLLRWSGAWGTLLSESDNASWEWIGVESSEGFPRMDKLLVLRSDLVLRTLDL